MEANTPDLCKETTNRLLSLFTDLTRAVSDLCVQLRDFSDQKSFKLRPLYFIARNILAEIKRMTANQNGEFAEFEVLLEQMHDQIEIIEEDSSVLEHLAVAPRRGTVRSPVGSAY